MSVNKVILLGRLGQDPELKTTEKGTEVCNFSVATSEKITLKSGEKKEQTEWHNIVVWGKLAQITNKYLSKGRHAYIEGKLQTNSWDDKEGKKRSKTQINANVVQFIGGQQKAQNNNQFEELGHIKKDLPQQQVGLDEIPF